MKHLFKEALIVGCITGIYGLAIGTVIFLLFRPDFTFKNYFWYQILLSSFITGFSAHIIFEETGLIKNACKNRKDQLNY